MSYIRHCFLPKHDYIAPTAVVIVPHKTTHKQIKRYQITLPFSDDLQFIAQEWPKLTQAVKMLYYAKHKETIQSKPPITPDDHDLIASFAEFSINSEPVSSDDSLESLQQDIDKSVEAVEPRKRSLQRAATQITSFTQRLINLENGSGDNEGVKKALTLFKEIFDGFTLVTEADESILFYLDHKEFSHLKKSDPLWIKQNIEDLYAAALAYNTLEGKEGENRFTRRIRKITSHLVESVIAKHGPKSLLPYAEVDTFAIDLEKRALHSLLFTNDPCDPFLDLDLEKAEIQTPILSTYCKLQSGFMSSASTLESFRRLFSLVEKAREEKNILLFAECAQKIENLAKATHPDYRHKTLLQHAKEQLAAIGQAHGFPHYYARLNEIQVEDIAKAEVSTRIKAFYKTVVEALWSIDYPIKEKATKRVAALSEHALMDDDLQILYQHYQTVTKK